MKAGGSRSGSILIIALFVATILGFLAASYTRSALAELKLSNATFWEKSAINIAEAGAETAVLALNTSDWSGWSLSSAAGFDVWREFPPFDVGNGQTGTVTVGVRNFGSNNPTIITEALIQLDSMVATFISFGCQMEPNSAPRQMVNMVMSCRSTPQLSQVYISTR